MKKIIYAITKIGKKEDAKITGIGYITDEDIITARVNKQNKPYIKVFEDAVKYCHAIPNTTDQYAGGYSEIVELDLPDDKGRNTHRELQIAYWIWYKLVD